MGKLTELIVLLLQIFEWFLLAWVVMSWIEELQGNAFYRKLDDFFSAILRPIRQVIPPIGGFLDISPLILILLLHFLIGFLV